MLFKPDDFGQIGSCQAEAGCHQFGHDNSGSIDFELVSWPGGLGWLGVLRTGGGGGRISGLSADKLTSLRSTMVVP